MKTNIMKSKVSISAVQYKCERVNVQKSDIMKSYLEQKYFCLQESVFEAQLSYFSDSLS